MQTYKLLALQCFVASMLLAAVLTTPQIGFAAAATQDQMLDNPNIDAEGYLAVTREALAHRAKRRLTEAEFLRMSAEPDTIVLDARSANKYAQLHIAGAVNLSFSDITAASLAQLIPSLTTRVLIYCNNNFANAQAAFPTKNMSASLNLSTYTALYNYGYRNVYELGPYLDATKTSLVLVAEK
jgi:phage shock protein E